MLAPSIMDTVFITKVDTIVLTKDSLITKVNLRLDTTKVDSLISELISLRAKGDPETARTVERLIYKEIIPDLTYSNVDSLKITIDGKVQWIRFNVDIKIRDDKLTVVTKPTGDITYVSETAVVSIDARRKSFWQDWKLWVLLGVIAAVWFFRGILGELIKRF